MAKSVHIIPVTNSANIEQPSQYRKTWSIRLILAKFFCTGWGQVFFFQLIKSSAYNFLMAKLPNYLINNIIVIVKPYRSNFRTITTVYFKCLVFSFFRISLLLLLCTCQTSLGSVAKKGINSTIILTGDNPILQRFPHILKKILSHATI